MCSSYCSDVLAVLRTVERVLSVAIGRTALYFGDRLFLSLPEQSPGSGQFRFPGGTLSGLQEIDELMSRCCPEG